MSKKPKENIFQAPPLLAWLFLLALIVRLVWAPLPGHEHDIAQLKIWVEAALEHNPLAVYSTSTANYPPLSLLPLIIIGYLQQWLLPGLAWAGWAGTALLKLPGIGADMATAVILYHYLSHQVNRRWATLIAASYALNPAIWYLSAWWGQLEALYTLPMLLSIQQLSQQKNTQSWFWFGIALLTKPQAAMIGPIILVGSWRHKGWAGLLKGGLIVGSTLLLGLAPLLITGQLPALLAQIRASAGQQLFLTMNAHNFWYLVTLGQGSFAARFGQPLYDTEPLLGPLTGWDLGLLALGTWTLLITYRLLRHPHPSRALWSGAAAALVIGFFLLPAESHERYLFPALALLASGSQPGSIYNKLYLLLSLTFLLNLLWVDAPWAWPTFNQQLNWGLPLAAINCLALVVLKQKI